MTPIGLRPALLFFSFAGVKTATSISARKLSNGTTRAIISSGSPFAVIAASRRSASKNPNCPIVPTPANPVVTTQIRTNSRKSLFFEVPLKIRPCNAHVDRYRWEILDNEGLLQTSADSFATEREAKGNGRLEMQDLIEMWNKK